jgi:hypothetical protein
MAVMGGRTARWGLVAVAAAALCAAPSVVASLPVHATPVGAAALRSRIERSADRPYSGSVRTQAELGLPTLPALGNVTSLLSGITSIRVWYRAADESRVDVIDTVGERDVYTTPVGQYTWDYGTQLLTEIAGAQPVRLPEAGDLAPPDLARRILAMDPVDTAVALPPARIAGVDADGIRLRPADPATTVGQVDIWADPATGVPLRVAVTARGASTPILTSQFQHVDLAAPKASLVEPPDTGQLARAQAPDIVGIIASISRRRLPGALAGYLRQPQLPGLGGVGRYGPGLATFVVVPLPGNIGSSAIDSATKAGGKKLTVAFGRAVSIQIPLLTVVIEQAGFRHRTYLLAGFVAPAVLTTAAGQLATLRRPIR